MSQDGSRAKASDLGTGAAARAAAAAKARRERQKAAEEQAKEALNAALGIRKKAQSTDSNN
jgi:hypothetical protein